MLLEVYKCVQLNRWFVVCGCVLQRGSGFRRVSPGERELRRGDLRGELLYEFVMVVL